MIEAIAVGGILFGLSLVIGTFGLRAACWLTIAWTWLCTITEDATARERRRLEVKAHLFDEIQAERAQGSSNPEIAMWLFVRFAWGAPGDVVAVISATHLPPRVGTFLLWVSWAGLSGAILSLAVIFPMISSIGLSAVAGGASYWTTHHPSYRTQSSWDRFLPFFWMGLMIALVLTELGGLVVGVNVDLFDLLMTLYVVTLGECLLRTRNAIVGTLVVVLLTIGCVYIARSQPLLNVASVAALIAPGLALGALCRYAILSIRRAHDVRRERRLTSSGPS